jgi:hypothetical protein
LVKSSKIVNNPVGLSLNRRIVAIDWTQLPRVLVFDGRNVLDRNKLTALGFEVIS